MSDEQACVKLDRCMKIDAVMDKDMLDFQRAEIIRETCRNCKEYEDESVISVLLNLRKYGKEIVRFCDERLREIGKVHGLVIHVEE